MRMVKSLILRLARVFTHHQVAFNHQLLAVVEDLIDRADRMDADLRRELSERHEDLASVRSSLVHIHQQLLASPRQPSSSAQQSPFEISEKLHPLPARDRSTELGQVLPEPRIPGVNVFGDWAATTGLAQAARRMVVALFEAGLDLSVGTIHSGAPLDESRVPHVLRNLPTSRKHEIDLWMLNINEFSAVGEELLRPSRETYAIAAWYWELPTFPERFLAQMNRVDEIWVATRFVQTSFQKATCKPVHVVPAIVPTLTGSGRGRQDFGLDHNETVFLFSFDVNSAVARKNPSAVIEAFSRAFPSPSEMGVRLVIKVLNLDRHPDVARWLEPLVSAVNGLIIAEDLDQAHLVDLFVCADAYVSLHRSEGFGFGIAEAMALGKPVIATAYSGNLDFTTMANSCQVGYRLRQITNADHVFNEGIATVYESGAVWADPDIAQAARWMQLLAADPELRSRLGKAGQATVQAMYGAEAAVRAVENRLLAISDRLG
jgi:glycosyltransferase involved in cell wall biosynthesis